VLVDREMFWKSSRIGNRARRLCILAFSTLDTRSSRKNTSMKGILCPKDKSEQHSQMRLGVRYWSEKQRFRRDRCRGMRMRTVD
jgi:hypothetical protein